jgi:hypothetical protein
MTSTVFGPWTPDIDGTERIAQLRCLAGLVAVYCGSANPLVTTLRQAEHDSDALRHASTLLDRVPSLTRRKLLSVFGAITWPRRARS